MRYGDIYPVEKMCKILKVSRSSYYYWRKHPISKRERRNRELLSMIKQVYRTSKGIYGSPRITKELKMNGVQVSKKKVAAIMQQNNIISIVKKKFKITTDSKHNYAISPNLLKQHFIVSKASQVWVSDITYIRTRQGWLYLTVILDLYDRKVIGWSMSNTMHTKNTIVPAWHMACNNREVGQSMIFHSDRGVQYASDKFRKILKAYPMVRQSMSRKANCWDNAVAESFFKSLKVEAIYPLTFNNRKDAKLAVFQYIEAWYNTNRRHSFLGGLTISEFEQLNQLNYAA